MRVLVVEDDARMAAAIGRGLRYEGLVVDVAADGEEALARVGAIEYDAVVLDVMLPGMDGVETCRRLRADGDWVPVLMLTARDAVEDRVRGLDGGADDYMTKPFSLAELIARLRALARRGQGERPAVLEVGDAAARPRHARGPARRRARSSCRRASSRCWRRSCAARARCSRRASCSRRPGTRLRAALQRRRGLRPLPAREDRPAVRRRRRSRPCAASATGCARTAAR